MILSPQQKRFTADAKAALYLKGLTTKSLAEELGVHPTSVRMAINFGQNAKVLARICERLEIAPPTEAVALAAK